MSEAVAVEVAGAGTQTLKAAQGVGKAIRLVGLYITGNTGITNVEIRDNAGSPKSLTGDMPMNFAGGPFAMNPLKREERGHDAYGFTGDNKAMVIAATGTGNVRGVAIVEVINT